MKDLGKTLTMSSQDQTFTLSMTKQTSHTDQPDQKTQLKHNNPKFERHLNQINSQNFSSLPTQIGLTHAKANQQAKNLISGLKDKIQELQRKLKNSMKSDQQHKKQISVLQNQIIILQKENQCLLEILEFEEEKTTAAISYISFLSKKITYNEINQIQFHQFFQLIKTIEKDNKNDNSKVIKANKNQNAPSLSFQFKPIQEKEEIKEHITLNIMKQIGDLKSSNEDLREKVSKLEAKQSYKNQSTPFLKKQIDIVYKQNTQLKSEINKIQKASHNNQSEIKLFQAKNKDLDTKIQQLQRSLALSNVKYQKASLQIDEIYKLHNSSIKESTELRRKWLQSEEKVIKLKQIQTKYKQLLDEKENTKSSFPNKSYQSQQKLCKSTMQNGQPINYELNCGSKQNINQKNDKQPQSKFYQFKSGETFWARHKSASLLKQMQIDPNSENIEQTNKQLCEISYRNNHQSPFKINNKLSTSQHNKSAKKYNYKFDIDSLNYFNNCDEGYDHQDTGLNGGDDNNFNE